MIEIQNLEIIRDAKTVENGSLFFTREAILSQEQASQLTPELVLEGQGFRAYPGLFNAHDHLLASYLPKIGGQSKHSTWLSFDNLYKSSGVFAERQQLPTEVLYFLGAYKNAFSGVSTVSDHIPPFVNQGFYGKLPIDLVTKYKLAHSVGSYELGWGEGPSLEYQLAVKKEEPFVLHLGEGLDEESKNSLKILEKLGALGKNSVLVHCLPFGRKEAESIQKSQATIVWCPISNIHIFGKTSNVALFRSLGIPICLGTDGSPSGGLHLWEEMRFAKKLYFDLFREELPSQELFSWVTQNPAQAFRMAHKGHLHPGASADFFLLPKSETDPFDFFQTWEPKQIQLFVSQGNPLWGKSPWDTMLGAEEPKEFWGSGEEILWVSGNLKDLFRTVDSLLGFKKDLAFFPFPRN